MFLQAVGLNPCMQKHRKLEVKLSTTDRRKIAELLRGGVQPVRVIKRAQSLRLLGTGQPASQVAPNVSLTAKAVREIGFRYVEQGLERALYDQPEPEHPARITAAEKQHIIAMVCSNPPEGQARWTVRLIAEEAVKRKLTPNIGRESVRVLLQCHDLKPWREKNVVRGGTGPELPRKDGGRTGGL